MAKPAVAQNVLKDAEAIGQIKSLPEVAVQPAVVEEASEVLDTPHDFQMAIGNAQMDGKEFVEVSEKLFKYLVKNNKTNYLTYGDPGVKVFKVGTREEIENEESMTAEQSHEVKIRKLRVAKGLM